MLGASSICKKLFCPLWSLLDRSKDSLFLEGLFRGKQQGKNMFLFIVQNSSFTVTQEEESNNLWNGLKYVGKC